MASRSVALKASSYSLSRRALSAAVLSALLGTPGFAAAQVTPDPNAGAHRPGTNTAANGVPVVNIVAPSAAGVSHNQYQQFNVDKQGLILNNSAGVSQTQLGGYIVGNPNYQAGKSAKVIVNEVTSTHPTYLHGYTELAGNAADVIIANPNGISVNGGGFINTNRATLTTGTPTFGADGSLSGLRTSGGTISIEGDGLNASNIDRLDLISRSLSVGGGVWANNLNVVTGANQVGYGDLSTQAIMGSGDAPTVSIDVAALGGMYANVVHLVASEAGIGVRNAGQLASQSGDFTIDASGELQLTGATSSAGNLTVNSASLSNSGTLYSGGNLALNVDGTLANSNVIAAARDVNLRAQQLVSSGTLGAGVVSDGSMQGHAALNVTTAGALSATGSNLASGTITLQGSALDLSGAQTRAGGNITITSTAGDVDHTNAMLATNGKLTVRSAGTVDNSGGTMQAGQLDAQAASWRNAYGSVMQTGSAPMNVQIAGMLDNTRGTWVANANTMALSANAINNTDGAIEQAGAGTLSIHADMLTNDQGQIVGNGDLVIASQAISNHGGTFSVAGNATLTGGELDNTGGMVVAQNFKAQLTGALSNEGGLLQAASAQLAANDLNNGNGQIKALTGNLDLAVARTLSNDIGGFLGSNASVNLSAGDFSNAGQIYTGADLVLNVQGDAVNSGALQALGSANVNIGGTLVNDKGSLEAGTGQADARLGANAASISNQSGRIANTDSGATAISSNTIDNTNGTIGGQGDVTLNAASITNNAGTLVSAGDFDLQSAYLKNQGGTLYSAGNLAWSNGGATLDNTGGSIGAGGDMALALGAVHNSGGDIAANNNVASQFNAFDGVGRLRAGNNLVLTLTGDYTNRAGNNLFANNDFTFNLGGALTNAVGATLQSVGALNIHAASLDNQSGAYLNSANTTLTATTQTNEGRIEGDTVTLNAGDISNTGTVIGNAITIHANALTNGADLGNQTDNAPYQTALIAAVNQLNLYVTGDLLNRDAMLYTLGDLTMAADANGTRSQSVTNLSGDIEAGGNVAMSTQQFTNQRRVFETEVHNLSAAEQAQNTQTSVVAITGATDADLYDYCVSIYVAHQYACRNNGDVNNNDPLQANGYINTTDVVTALTRLLSTSAESRLLAGGNITLNGSVLNDKSTIAAGNNLTINGQNGDNGGGSVGGDTVQNIAFTPTATVQTIVRKWVSMKYKSGGFDGAWHSLDDLNFFSLVSDNTLAMSGGQIPWWITLDPGPALSARISAGNAVDINAQDISNTVVGADGQPVAGVNLGANAGGLSLTGQPGHGAQTIGDSTQPLGSISLPSSGLYAIHPGSSTPYLVETDPRFASYSGFLGSDYLLNQLGLQGDLTLKRLGDAFYETQLVMGQITSLTGRVYLDGNTDALDQYKALMDAGTQEAKRFDLAVGVALTPAQMANLNQDIVWLVNETVGGEQVLVPVVYLSQQTANNVANGAVIQGSSVALNANNQITNTGTIQSANDANLQAGNLLNAGSLSAGGNLSVQAAQDLLNVGSMQGGNVALVAGNNLGSSANAKGVSLGNVNLSGLSAVDAQRLGVQNGGQLTAVGTLTAQAGQNLGLDHANLSAGGNLGVAAGNNVTATASALTAGNNVQVIAGNNLDLNADQHTVYQGTSDHLTVQTVHDVTTVQAGGSAVLAARNDLTSDGSILQAGNALALSAGHDITLGAVTDQQITQGYARDGKTDITTMNTDQALRGNTLSGTNGVAISAGDDVSIIAGAIHSDEGNVALAAGHNINLVAGQESHTQQQDTHSKTGNLLSNSQSSTHDVISDTYAVGTPLSGSNVSLAAGNDLNAQAAYLDANQALTIAASHDVNLTDAQDIHTEDHESATSSFSFFSTSSKRFGSIDPEWRSNSSSTQINQSSSVGNVLSGDSVTVAAGHDLTATNAQVVATNDVVLAAGNNLTLNAGQNSYDYNQSNSTSHTGLMNNGGLSVLIGNRSTKDSYSVNDTSYSGSTVGSLNGSVTLSAGNDVHITGSDVLSQTGTAIVGENVTIDAAVGSTEISESHKISTGGINVGIGGIAAQVANATYYSVQRGSQVQDGRLSALYAAQAAYQGSDAVKMAQGGGLSQDGTDGGINLQVGIGGSSASSTTATHDETAYGSHINSHANVTIAATGGDLNIIGSQISGDNVALAANNLNLLSQAENHTLNNNNQNVSAGVGLQIGTEGIGIYAQAAVGKGDAHGNGITHQNTTVNADGTLTLISGNDTTIKGAQLIGQQVVGAIGNNLLIQSEQDTDDYATKQWQAAGKVVIGYSSGGSLSYNQSKTYSHYRSVNDVSGIGAGDGGFNIVVGGNTHLIGGVIASNADPSRNLLDTGSLTYESIHNEANYSASSFGASASYSNGPSEFGFDGFGGMPLTGVPQKGNGGSDTNSGIAQGTLIVRDGNTDLSSLDRNPTLGNQALAPIFDAQKVQENMELGQVAGYVGMRNAGSIASYMANHATTKEEQAAWSDGGTNKILLHGLVGAATAALGGGNALQGALGAGASEAASKAMSDYLSSHDIDPYSPEGKSLMALASAAIGATVGRGTGATTALQGDLYNRQLHKDEIALAKKLANESGGLYTQDQIEDAMRMSGNSKLGESALDGMLVNSNDAAGIYDTSANWTVEKSPSGDQTFFMQMLPEQISPDLVNYITSNTGGSNSAYSWTYDQQGLKTPKEPYIPYLAVIPDYISISGAAFGWSGAIALNMHTGQIYGGASGTNGVSPGFNYVAGYLPINLGETSLVSAYNTTTFLKGAAGGLSGCYILCAGFNHSYGGDTAIEIGAGIGVPSKGASGSTGLMFPLFNLPFTSGDKKRN